MRKWIGEIGRDDRDAAAARIERAAIGDDRIVGNARSVLLPGVEPAWAEEDAVERHASQKEPGRDGGRESEMVALEILVIRQNLPRREAYSDSVQPMWRSREEHRRKPDAF